MCIVRGYIRGDGMSSQDILEAWAEENTYTVKGYTGKHYSPFVCNIMNMLDKRVRNCECEWAAPYGRVISADCKEHD